MIHFIEEDERLHIGLNIQKTYSEINLKWHWFGKEYASSKFLRIFLTPAKIIQFKSLYLYSTNRLKYTVEFDPQTMEVIYRFGDHSNQ